MSADSVTVGLAHLSFDRPESNYLLSQTLLTDHATGDTISPTIKVTREKSPRNNWSRNRQCVPSDDEEDDEEEDIESDEEEECDKQTNSMTKRPVVSTPTKPTRKTTPLPSDDEDSEDDDQDDKSDTQTGTPMYRMVSGSAPNLVSNDYAQDRPGFHPRYSDSSTNSNGSLVPPNHSDEIPVDYTQFNYEVHQDDDDDNEVLGVRNGPLLTEGSHLQQLQQYQQYHQAQLAQFQLQAQPHPSKSSSTSHLRPNHHPQQRVSMSGMDLLKQLEQEKAEAKRQKPKSQIKIEGLLAKLPEPGSHNISFQQMQMKKPSKNQRLSGNMGYHHHYPHHPHHNSPGNSSSDRRSFISAQQQQHAVYPFGYPTPYDMASQNAMYMSRSNAPSIVQPSYAGYPQYVGNIATLGMVNNGNPALNMSMPKSGEAHFSRPASALSMHEGSGRGEGRSDHS